MLEEDTSTIKLSIEHIQDRGSVLTKLQDNQEKDQESLLEIPDDTQYSYYTITKGDTLQKISVKL